MQRPDAPLTHLLKRHGLRPTRQRLALARLLFSDTNRHVSAEALHEEALGEGASVSLATVYNTLNQFTAVGLLREVVVDPNRCYFDTNTTDHHHLYFEDTGCLEDLEPSAVRIGKLPDPPAGTAISRVDLVIRLSRRPERPDVRSAAGGGIAKPASAAVDASAGEAGTKPKRA